MIWLSATFQPTTLFSLKPSWATSSGGKSLLLPTPYALKMALLDAAIRLEGKAQAENAWSWLRTIEIGIRLPEQIIVTNLFAKILKLRRNPAPEGAADAGPFQKTIGYREYVYHPQPIKLAIGLDDAHQQALICWLLNINYLGKRGGFMQLMKLPHPLASVDDHILLTRDLDTFPTNGFIQQVDDCDPKMTFDQASIYTKKRPKRIVRPIVLPYSLTKSSRSYSLYERI